MDKEEYVKLFNGVVGGSKLSFEKEVLPVVSEYLTEINYENYQQKINLIVQQPQLVDTIWNDLVKYYCKKHNICYIMYKFKPILYY